MASAMALVLSPTEGRAQTTEWTGAASADWSDPANWTNGLPTPASGTARINTDTPHPTLIDGASVAARGLYVGEHGAGSLEIRNGGTLANTWTAIGVFSAWNSGVVVAGPGSRWDASSVVTVAEYGVGTLDILDGAQAHFDGLLVGLESGGPGARGRGTVTVSGAGSLLTANWPEIGVFGDIGILNVFDGGRVSVPTDAYVAGPRKGEVNVRGEGSVFEIGENLEAAWDAGGEANVTVSDGGLLDVAGMIILPAHATANASLNIGAASGAAAAAPGVVQAGGGVVFGAGAGRVVFNHTGADHAFAPRLLGAGEIRVESGRTRLSGDQSGFTGVTNVTGGALAVDGVLRGTLGVSGSGRLEGTGTVGATTIAAGGTIAPGNSIGTLTIDGDATFEPGSRFEVEVEPGGVASDRIDVTGTAFLNGGTVAHIGRAGAYRPQSTYTILTAQGGVEGRFDAVRSDFAFLDPSLGYGANEVSLTLTRNDIAFSQKAVTANQKASAGALDALSFGNPVHDAVVVLGESEARAAFEELSGEIHASAKAPLIGGSQAVRGVVEQRLRGTLAPPRRAGPIASYASLDPREEPAGANAGLWARGFGNWGRVRGDAQARGLRHDEGGVVAGADLDLAEFVVLPGAVEALRVGLFGGYSRSTARLEARSAAAASRNAHFGVYGGADLGALRLTGGASHALHRVDSVRRLAVPGLEQTLTAAYGAATTQLFAEAGYRADLGGFALEPFAGLGYLRFSRDGYAETGGAAALTVTRRSQNSAFSTIGLRAFAEFDLAGMTATAHGSVGWRRAYEAGRTSAEVSLAGTGPFRVQGAMLERDAAILEAGLDLDLGDRATLSLSYDGRQSARSAEHGLAARIRASF